MTTQELVTEVLDHQFNSQRYGGRIVKWLDEGQKHIVRQTDVRTQRELLASTLTVGIYGYAMPSDFARILSVSLYADTDVQATQLNPINLETWIAAEDASGKPTNYIFTESNLINLYPAPDSAYTLEIYYWRLPETLSAVSPTVDPEIPEEYYDLLVDYALWKAYKAEHDFDAAREHKQDFDVGLSHMRTEVQSEHFDGPTQVAGTWANAW